MVINIIYNFIFTKGGYMKKGFTMAEVLVTLGIIGVVAAMTLPQVLINYKKQEVANKLKKTYSILNQAIRTSENDNESTQYWNTSLSGHDFFEIYLKKYFIHPVEISKSELTKKVQRKNLNGSNYTGTTYNGGNTTNFLTNDGALITINLNNSNDGGLWVGIDVNGFAKPNTVGKDTFLFFFNHKTGLNPLGWVGSPSIWECKGKCDREEFINGSNSGSLGCKRGERGYWCAALIMADNWEIKDDYPWDN